MVSNMFYSYTYIPGEMIQFDEHIFQKGWNHQLKSTWICFAETLQNYVIPSFWETHGQSMADDFYDL